MTTENDDLADEVMCLCSGTTRGDIERMFAAGLDMEAISRKTGALSGCAGCEWDVAELLRELAEQQA
ncbi:MAG TPA: (2Fe-2S)-binding protein [Methylophilus sp.]